MNLRLQSIAFVAAYFYGDIKNSKFKNVFELALHDKDYNNSWLKS